MFHHIQYGGIGKNDLTLIVAKKKYDKFDQTHNKVYIDITPQVTTGYLNFKYYAWTTAVQAILSNQYVSIE